MTEERKRLIEAMQSIINSNPREQILAATLANVAEDYCEEQIKTMKEERIEQLEQRIKVLENRESRIRPLTKDQHKVCMDLLEDIRIFPNNKALREEYKDNNQELNLTDEFLLYELGLMHDTCFVALSESEKDEFRVKDLLSVLEVTTDIDKRLDICLKLADLKTKRDSAIMKANFYNEVIHKLINREI